MYKVASLFCGCGGNDRGMVGGFRYNRKLYKKLPFSIVYANDIDEKAIATYKANFGTKGVHCQDICTVDTNDIPDHDILVGGFPCQSFSTVNPTKDPFDDRANLYKQMVRVAKAKQPKVIVAENVKGFMTLYKGKIFKRVKSEFEALGYTIYSSLLNASDYGIPQKRERVFIIGIHESINKEWEFPKATTPERDTPLSVAVPKLELDEKKYYFSKRAVEGMKRAKNNMKRGLWQDLSEPCLTITSHLAKVSLNSRDPVLLVDPENELYRRFTPREAATIQSFPNSFKFVGSEGDAYRQIGNAIPPVLAWHIFNELRIFLNETENEYKKSKKETILKGKVEPDVNQIEVGIQPF